MRLLRIWRDGALARLAGGAFALNPHAPGPHGYGGYSGYFNPHEAACGRAWANGYWWADKHHAKRAERARGR